MNETEWWSRKQSFHGGNECYMLQCIIPYVIPLFPIGEIRESAMSLCVSYPDGSFKVLLVGGTNVISVCVATIQRDAIHASS